VCKQWRDTIHGSNQTQVALCLRSIKADPGSETFSKDHIPDVFVSHSPINAYTYNTAGIQSASMSPSVGQIFTDMKSGVASGFACVNPLLRHIFPSTTDDMAVFSCDLADLYRHRNSKNLLLRRTWVMQPPAKQIKLKIFIDIVDEATADGYVGDPLWCHQHHGVSLGWKLEYSSNLNCVVATSKELPCTNPDGLSIADLLQGLLGADSLRNSISSRAGRSRLPANLKFKIVAAA
jgi:hypothetical protein